MKKIIFTFLAAAGFAAINSVAAIRWIDKDYDFGLFKEIAGPKTGTSRFVNLGPDTISIVDVHPSCGCTSADYTRTPLLPGDTAVISYTYDPSMRPGKFEKSVRVTLSNNVRQIIRIRGNVLGTPESLSVLYPVDAGTLRLSENIAAFGEVKAGHNPIAFLNAYVLSTDSISPGLFSESEALTVTPSAEKAGPGDIVTFTLSLNTDKLNKFGPVEIPLRSVDIPADIKAIAVVFPDENTLRILQHGKSPAIDTYPALIDMGNTDKGPVSSEFTVSNSGKAPLEILKIYSTSDAVSLGKYPDAVKPGKTAKISFEINPEKLNPGPQRVSIEIITTDPNRSHVSLPVAVFK